MTTTEAARLLDLPLDSSPEQLENRFLELRAKLEDKIAKAPTPGLKEKYRSTLADVTDAFETLTMEADNSDLPLIHQFAPAEIVSSAPSAIELPKPTPDNVTINRDTPSPLPHTPKVKTSGNRKFAIVALIAVTLLGSGGWWVMKIWAENDEKARLEAVEKAETDRKTLAAKVETERKLAEEKAAADKEKARQESLLAQLRANQAEQKIGWESLEKELTAAERKLSELNADLRNIRELTAPQQAEHQARFAAQERFVEWLQPYLSRHPVKTQLAKLDTFLSSKTLDDASSLSVELTQGLTKAEQEVASQKKNLLAVTSLVEISSDPSGLRYQGEDAYGRKIQGLTPFSAEFPLGTLVLKIIAPSAGWADYEEKTTVKRGETHVIAPVFGQGALLITSVPSPLDYEVSNSFGYNAKGSTAGELAKVPAGKVEVKVRRPGWPDIVQSVVIKKDEKQSISSEFSPGNIAITSEPNGAGVFEGEKSLGTTPLNLENLIPGEHTYLLRLKGYQPQMLVGSVRGGETKTAHALLVSFLGPVEGDSYLIPNLNITMLPVASGLFSMGSPNQNQDKDKKLTPQEMMLKQIMELQGLGTSPPDEQPAHQVSFKCSFWLGQTEVTQAQWMLIMGSNPSRFKDANFPVEQVSWADCMKFCEKVTEREKEAGRLPVGFHYTLPTEAQWEYVCRAGTTGLYAGLLAELGWYSDNSGNMPHVVGTKKPNAWGFHDMHGNVFEWCSDWYGVYPSDAVIDPTGVTTGSQHIVRGGSWNTLPGQCRSTNRFSFPPSFQGNNLGFRLALSPAPLR